MAKMTKAQRAAVHMALNNAIAARDYIMSPRNAFCVRDTMATTNLHYARSDGAVLYEVERAYGSPLCRIETAIHGLTALLDTESG